MGRGLRGCHRTDPCPLAPWPWDFSSLPCFAALRSVGGWRFPSKQNHPGCPCCSGVWTLEPGLGVGMDPRGGGRPRIPSSPLLGVPWCCPCPVCRFCPQPHVPCGGEEALHRLGTARTFSISLGGCGRNNLPLVLAQPQQGPEGAAGRWPCTSTRKRHRSSDRSRGSFVWFGPSQNTGESKSHLRGLNAGTPMAMGRNGGG